MFAGPPSDCRRWMKIGLPPRLPESVPGCPGAWDTPFCPFLAKTGGSRWDFFDRDHFSSTSHRRLVQASIFLVLLSASEILGIFFYW